MSETDERLTTSPLSEDDEDDDFDDISPPTTLRRGDVSASLSTSPGGSNRDPSSSSTVLGFFKRTFSGKKTKDLKGLKERLKTYKNEIECLKAELSRKNQQLDQVLQMVRNNPYYVQVGDNNTMIGVNNDDDLEELKKLVETLTNAVEENMEKRAESDMELGRTELVLEEMRDAFKDYSVKLENKSDKDTVRLDELRTILYSDRSDSQVMKECVDTLQEHIQIRIVIGYDDIPERAQLGIRRLVHKFGSFKWFSFAKRLGVRPSTIQKFPYEGDSEKIGADNEKSDDLDRDTCSKILVEWIKATDNTSSKLLAIVQMLEKKQSKDLIRSFQQETVRSLHASSQGNARNSLYSEKSEKSEMSVPHSETTSGQMHRYGSMQLQETRTTQAHIVEALMMLQEMYPLLIEMAPKVDDLHSLNADVRKKSLSGDSAKDVCQNAAFVRKSLGDPIHV